MNRQYSRDGLLKMYQQEATDNKDKRLMEKQARVMEERAALDNLNRELEQEKRMQQNSKMQRVNERMEEYNKMLVKKQNMKEETRGNRRAKDDLGTFKIGGENREIKKKNYEEISNTLVLNPMRENVNVNTNVNVNNINRGRNEIGSGAQQRGKSQGFNIINHSNYNDFPRTNYGRIGNKVENERDVNNNPIIANNMNRNVKHDNYPREVEGIENLENFPYSREVARERDQRDYQSQYQQNQNYPSELKTQNREEVENPPEYDEAEFQKYYEQYLQQKMMEQEMQNQENKNQNTNNIPTNPNNIPTTMKEYEAYKSAQQKYPTEYNEDYGQNELEQQMNKLNIQGEQEKEYYNNKMRNQNGYGFNHVSQKPENYYSNSNSKQANLDNPGAKKIEQQEQYRNYLNSQIQEKNMIKNSNMEYNTNNSGGNNQTSNTRVRISKKDMISSNPYTTKNYEFGGSSLSHNPITNPVNSYQFNYNKFRQPIGNVNNVNNVQNGNREIGSARMRAVGNNIMK